jgi:uncharacterized protein DUF6585
MSHQQITGIDPHTLGQQHNLGNFKKEYGRIFVFSPWWPFVVAAFPLLFVVLIFRIWLVLGLSLILDGICLLCVLLILSALVSPARDLIKEFRAGKPIAWLYDQGFILLTSKGNIQMVARWTDLDVWHRIESEGDGSLHVYTVVDRTKRASMELPLGAPFNMAVEWEVATFQYPSKQTAYQSGQVIDFGRLSVSSQGVHDTLNSTLLAWSDIESIKINHTGGMRIKRRQQKGDWIFLGIGQLANVATLCRLLHADVPRSFVFQNQARIA